MDGIPRGVAGRSQTVDVYGGSTATIFSGGFRLTYGGNAEIVTPCITANTSELTADAISSALASANAFLNVTVTEDEPPYDGARRFVVFFNEPELGVVSLGVADADGEECEWLRCSGGDGEDDEECEDSGVVIDRDASVSVQEGTVEASVLRAGRERFSQRMNRVAMIDAGFAIDHCDRRALDRGLGIIRSVVICSCMQAVHRVVMWLRSRAYQ